MMTNVGNAALSMMYPCWLRSSRTALPTGPALMPGLMGGYLAQTGMTTATKLSWIPSGFWGAIVAGFAAGLAVRLLNYLFRRIPQELDHIKTGLLVPLLSLAVCRLADAYGHQSAAGAFQPLDVAGAWMGCRAAAAWCWVPCWVRMMATDYGGPINKAAYVSGTLALVDQQYDLMAAVMAGGMIPRWGWHWPACCSRRGSPDRALLCAADPADGRDLRDRGALPVCHCAIRCGSASPASQAVHWPGS